MSPVMQARAPVVPGISPASPGPVSSMFRLVGGSEPPPIRFVPIAGTWAWTDAWCVDDTSPFEAMMIANGFTPIRGLDGRPFRWTTNLAGMRIGKDEKDWLAGADAAYYFADLLPYHERNFIAHSHGGQVALFLAASGFKIRSLTTIGTPPRSDVPAAKALANIGYWQHIYDLKWDWMGLLGQFGEGNFHKRRAFGLPGMTDRALPHISHSEVLRDAEKVKLWLTSGWLDAIREASDSPAA